MKRKIYRSKYNFGKLKPGEIFKVDALDLDSMKNSLRFHNNTHNRKMEVEVVGEQRLEGHIISYTVKRTK